MCDLAIFIDSFDGNSDVWPVFFKIYDKFWKDCIFSRYLVTNNLDFDTGNLKVIKTGNEKNWFHMSIKGLEAIPNKYILFLLEDYGISRCLANEDVSSIVLRMEEDDVFYYRLTSPDNFPNKKTFLEVPESTNYPISLQPAIWKKDSFLSFLKTLYAEGLKTPWDFEKFFIDKYKDGDPSVFIEGIRYDSRDLMGYQNLIIQGKWDPRVLRRYKKLGLTIDIGSREKMSGRAVFFDGIKRNKVIRSLSDRNQLKLKRLLKRFGMRFMT